MFVIRFSFVVSSIRVRMDNSDTIHYMGVGEECNAGCIHNKEYRQGNLYHPSHLIAQHSFQSLFFDSSTKVYILSYTLQSLFIITFCKRQQ